MKNLNQYITGEMINEQVFPSVHSFPESWQPYIMALYILILLWISIFLASGLNDITFGISSLVEIVKDKFDEFKYKKQLIEMKKALESNEKYIKWENDKNHKLKDLRVIIKDIKDDPNINKIIREIWEESKK